MLNDQIESHQRIIPGALTLLEDRAEDVPGGVPDVEQAVGVGAVAAAVPVVGAAAGEQPEERAADDDSREHGQPDLEAQRTHVHQHSVVGGRPTNDHHRVFVEVWSWEVDHFTAVGRYGETRCRKVHLL